MQRSLLPRRASLFKQAPMRRTALSLLGLVVLFAAGCDPEVPPLPVLRNPAHAYPTPKARDLPANVLGGAESLADYYAKEEPAPTPKQIRGWVLHQNSNTIIANFMRAVVKDDTRAMRAYITPDAGWGMPDRREIQRREIAGEDGGVRFTGVAREVAARFPATAGLTCPPVMAPADVYVATGAEPYWCIYQAPGLDPSVPGGVELLVFKLVMYKGEVRIDYVGLFETPLTRQLNAMPELGFPPPLVAPRKREPGSLVREIDMTGAPIGRGEPPRPTN